MEAHTTILPPISLSHTKLSHLNLLPSLEDTHGKNTRFPYIYIYIYVHYISIHRFLSSIWRKKIARDFRIVSSQFSSKPPLRKVGRGRRRKTHRSTRWHLPSLAAASKRSSIDDLRKKRPGKMREKERDFSSRGLRKIDVSKEGRGWIWVSIRSFHIFC